jgi:signal transduction histidine kinase
MLVGVLSNLLNSAIRHGAPPVELNVRRLDDRIRRARPRARNSRRTSHQVIMPFGRGPAPTSGTGLGLSVVRKFATGQGGELVIDDAEPGFRMVLRIPVDPPIA